jgi:hypothetical protein
VPVPRQGAQPARTAVLTLRFGAVEVCPLVTTLRAAPHYEFGVVNLAMALPLAFNEA